MPEFVLKYTGSYEYRHGLPAHRRCRRRNRTDWRHTLQGRASRRRALPPRLDGGRTAAAAPDLRPEEVYAALTYFYDHHDELVAAITATADDVEAARGRQTLSRAELLRRKTG